MATVLVPGFGFRPADGVRMRAPVVIEQGSRALKVMDLSTTSITTDVAFEIRDDTNQSACLAGAIDHRVLGQSAVTLTDERGVNYPPSDKGANGIGIGQHEFGFFSRQVSFERLPGHTRHVTLGIRGGLGDWEIPVDVVPITESGAVAADEIGAAATNREITVHVTRAAFAPDQTFIEVEATTSRNGTAIVGIGDIQRQGDERMVIVDEAGARYVEELSRETVRRQRSSAYAKFPAIPGDAGLLTLIVRSVQLEDDEPQLDVQLPLSERREMRLGRYPVLVGPMEMVNDLLAPPGKDPTHGLRFAMGAAESSGEDALLPLALGINGDAKRSGWGRGWHSEPGFRNLSIELAPDATPRSVRMEGALVNVRGPWEIRFARSR